MPEFISIFLSESVVAKVSFAFMFLRLQKQKRFEALLNWLFCAPLSFVNNRILVM